ncbi:MAG: hypothetical protein DCC56_01330 [Anaerolineae bacterium]|nr:MAG: hypothetical protein DCC56_01330 [Anaerolineae bacterium]WKZ44677.1 MAG: hypothetical protein QY302_02660 [Anaerolineales bacterium]
MSYSNWQKGSQWRKWDLHVHTPASFHWNGGKTLREMNDEEKDQSFNKLLNTIENSDVAAFCFTDYWTFDGYLHFNDYMRRSGLSCSKMIFPGMELRVEAPVDYRLNMQVILSDSLTVQSLEDFKSKLMVRSLNRRISDESVMEFAKSLDAGKAKIHGFDDPKKLGESDLLRLGASTIEVTQDSLKSAMESVPPGTVYLIMPFETSDGLARLDWKTQPQAANYFMQAAHVFESRKEEIMHLFLGIETEANRNFLGNFQKSLGNVQKPVISGSDAHKYSDYGKYPNNKATWIKADPTFQGFKQIIYEPRERVQIQELQPQEKIPYRVIDKVRFVDNTNEKIFSSEWIDLNENLNAIIGGKSSGKSLILYHIAKTIDPTLVEERSKEVEILEYYFGLSPDFDFEVMWSDGRTDKLSVPPEGNVREIEYIPQLYVNALAERTGKASLYKLIESILEQNIEYREFIQEVRQDIAQLEIVIDSNVAELLRRREEHQTLVDERKAIGDHEAIEEEIKRLETRISELSKDSNFTDAERTEYEKLNQLRVKQGARKRKFDELGNAIDGFTQTLTQIRKKSTQELENPNLVFALDSFSRRVLSALRVTVVAALSTTFDLAISSQTALAQRSRVKAERCSENERKISEKLKPYTDKIRDQAQLKDFTAKLKEQHDILIAYNEKTSLINGVTEVGVKTRDELFENYTNLLGGYQKIIEKLVNDKYSKIDSDIVLEASLKFDTENFSSSFGSLFDRRSSSFKAIFGKAFSENNDFHFDETSHIQNVSEIFRRLSTKTGLDIIFRKGTNQNDAISQLFRNYFLIEYNIRYKNDEILDMSPGKRGLVLLQLILHISNATHPILIDQPEDNLDNRTISDELRKFITAKKLMRQIIMVTHDANLVVLTDAENVVVSNQDGQQINRENAEFRFEYVAGALENSFRILDDANKEGVLSSCGIREHVCDILEGGEAAFKKREEKYGFSNR